MSAAVFPSADVVDRLVAKVPALRLIGDVAELQAAIDAQPKALPAAFVVVSERGHTPAGASGGTQIQKVEVWLSVVLIVANKRMTATGSEARRDMDALIASVDSALLNWRPDGSNALPLYFSAGRDEAYKPVAGQLTHQRIYQTERRNQLDRNP